MSKTVIARPDFYQNPTTEDWFEHPADENLLEEFDPMKVGDIYELDVSWSGKQKFRVIELDTDGQVKDAEFVSGTILYTTPPSTNQAVREFAEKALEAAKQFLNYGYQHRQLEEEFRALLVSETDKLSGRHGQAQSSQSGDEKDRYKKALLEIKQVFSNKWVWKGSSESNDGVRRCIAELQPIFDAALSKENK
jgi:hypothetical protein